MREQIAQQGKKAGGSPTKSRTPAKPLQRDTEEAPPVQQAPRYPTGALDLRANATRSRQNSLRPSDVEEEEEGEDDLAYSDDVWPTRSPSSARRYNQPVPPGVYTNGGRRIQVHEAITQQQMTRRASAGAYQQRQALPTGISKQTEDVYAPTKRNYHPFVYLGIGMFIVIVLWQGFTLLSALWVMHQDDMTYGRPRTFQFDGVVGHNGDSQAHPTHFVIINLNRRVEIIEQPAGDISHARMYVGPTIYSEGGDLVPVTGKVYDVNGDGKPDLILIIQTQQIVYLNDGTQFKPATPSQQNTINLSSN